MTTDRTTAFESITGGEYRKERSEPRAGQPFCLHLSDLLMAIRRSATHDSLAMLDYGAAHHLIGNCFLMRYIDGQMPSRSKA